ncbi:MAG: phosphonate ABC transporter ATP-binding protein [Thermus sp.]|uniref:phosphonate ABC transporter ATP-binding protein n=1 Tax=Thermus sp. TaxID=275 RepID=UPI00391897D4
MEISVQSLSVRFGAHWALRSVSLKLFEGGTPQVVALIGPSGSGKTTFIRVLKGLVPPTEGQVQLGPWLIRPSGVVPWRLVRQVTGMVFQQFQLVERLTVLENVLLGRLPRMRVIDGVLRRFSRADVELARYLLDRVGMLEHAWKRVDRLSGGQRQRVGIARALAQEPRLVLADEPIAALDPKNAMAVMELLLELVREKGVGLLVALHHVDLVRAHADRIVAFRKGEIFFDGTSHQFSSDIERELYFGEEDQGKEEGKSLLKA